MRLARIFHTLSAYLCDFFLKTFPLGAALEAMRAKSKTAWRFCLSPEIDPGFVWQTSDRTECGLTTERRVSFPG